MRMFVGGDGARRRPWWLELALVGLVATAAGMSLSNHVSDVPQTEFTVRAFVLPAVASTFLLLRRWAPFWTVGIVTVLYVVSQSAGHPGLPFIPVFGVAMYTVARHYDRRPAWTATLLVMLSVLTTALVWGQGPVLGPQRMAPLAWIALATTLGDAARIRQAYVAALEERAARAERTREEEAERRVAEERMRIAQELHDVVAHELTLINAQAGVAAHLGRHNTPAMMAEVLTNIRNSSKQALGELRAVVGLLGQPGDSTGPPTEPVPGLERLEDLVDSFARAGLRVQVVQEGVKRSLPVAVDVASYRIVQEALTNVRKHAGVEDARVRLAFGHDTLRIVVENDPASAIRTAQGCLDGGGTGRGLISMRERSAAVGGQVSIGPVPSGGFTVDARLPLGRARVADREAR
ncbi:sensor histidine kinase [Streptomyces justiciae]|uniref:sensor histidine kinase n=1 Tax=Streptomyces justiciae TaxID=2780140 RepID=UPI00211849EA|nr:histidine kinase [Streptomyces justiciae]MCW8379743.1 histidine kinase [Streptomyces justiciae]